MSRQVGLEEVPIIKEDNPEVNNISNLKGFIFQQSTLLQKVAFKASKLGIADEVYNVFKQIHYEYFLNNCKDIFKLITVNYKHRGPKIAMSIQDMEKHVINIPK